MDWKKKYKDILVSPHKAIKAVNPGSRIFIGSGCSHPSVLVKALVEQKDRLAGIEVIDFLTLGDELYKDKNLAEKFRINSFLIPRLMKIPQENFIAFDIRNRIKKLEYWHSYTLLYTSE